MNFKYLSSNAQQKPKNGRSNETLAFRTLPNHQTCTAASIFHVLSLSPRQKFIFSPLDFSLATTRPTESFNYVREFMLNQTENKIASVSSRRNKARILKTIHPTSLHSSYNFYITSKGKSQITFERYSRLMFVYLRGKPS